MKKNSLIAGIFLIAGLCGCKTSKPAETSLGSIGGEPIRKSEFKYVYNKNNSNTPDAYSKESIDEYLKLYVNFRLKVKAAESLGLDTTQSFVRELGGYKKQLAQPYFSEKEVTDKFTKQAYERLKEEVNASHILIAVKPDAEPEDTMAAWEKITDIRNKALKGEDFNALAYEFSDDPSAKQNKGNLGYFTALQMVYPFEDAAYATKPGDISHPVRTRFGYHILKVHDKRPSQGQVKVAHLMVRATEGMPASDSIAAKQKIDELYKKLQAGEDWNKLVAQFSDDVNSREKGGELPWFSTGRMIPSFEEAAFALKEKGDFSAPVQTPYGWHIIKLLDRKGLGSFKELEPKIKAKVQRDRADVNRKVLISRLKRENNFEEYPLIVKKSCSVADSSLLQGKWKIPADVRKESVLFVINNDKYTAGDFYEYVLTHQRPKRDISPTSDMNNLYNEYQQSMLIDYEERHLADKYEDYRMLVKEYRDGILLFQLMDEKVWSKAIEDTAGLRKFYEANKEKYKWEERANAVIFNVVDTATLSEVKKHLSKDYYPSFEPKLEPIYFAQGVDTLSKGNLKNLNKLIPYLITKKELVVRLNPSVSGKEHDEDALKRVKAVKNFLLSKKIDSSRILVSQVQKVSGSAKEKDNQKSRKIAFELLSTSPKSLEKFFNKDTPLSLEVTEGLFQKGDNEIFKEVSWKPDTLSMKRNDRYTLVLIRDIEPARIKKLEETKGMVISDYQEFLEKEWLKELREKYTVVLNQEEVDKLIKE